jgi:hypothetical protein
MTRFRPLAVRALAAATAAALVPAVAAAPAQARLVDSGAFHDELTQTYTNYCGVTGLSVDSTLVVDGRYRIVTHGPDGLGYFTENIQVSEVLTNPATGLSARITERVLNKDLSITRDGDLLTIVVLATGNATAYGPDGRAIGRNPGQVRFRVVIDDQGTPDDFEDDEEVSFELVKGSTGRSDDFCAVLVPALT